MDSTHDLLARWDAWSDRGLWRKTLANPDAKPEQKALAEQQLDELKWATGLSALAANVRLVTLLKGWQWLAIKSAREDGATWEQIGNVLGTSKQGALNAYTRAIEHQEKYVPDLHDDAAARAVLGDDAAAAIAEAEGETSGPDVITVMVQDDPSFTEKTLTVMVYEDPSVTSITGRFEVRDAAETGERPEAEGLRE